MDLNPPATEREIEQLTRAVGLPLPDVYLELLRTANGAEGFVGENYIRLRDSDTLSADPFPFGQFVPGLFLFAGDGSEANFGFDLSEGSDRVLVVHNDELDRERAVELASTLREFLQLLRRRDWIEVWQERRGG